MFATRYAAPVRASAARAAQSRAALAPTFVSGQLFLWDSRANALVHASISRRTNKAAARACHRRYWPETNVGASAARDCAARAALDLTGAEDAPATLARNHRISHRDRIRADRCLPQGMQRLLERAPPARRIASCARSYVCFGPIIPVGFARERLGACLNIAPYKQGGRARLSQALLARNKRRSERSSRCAARAALDLTGTEDAAATLARNHGISHRDRIRADRCLSEDMQRLLERAPPARRIASCARSYVCFGPIIPVGFARERLGACLNIAPYKQGGRARLSQALLARNKRRSERSSRCAARAALDLTGTEDAAATLARNHRISHRYCTGLGAYAVEAGLRSAPATTP
ncbi:hypothetical protein PSEG_01595 [Pseudomonas sp. Nvir]